MAKARTLVGLDVHATKIVAAVLDAETGELQSFAMNGDIARGGRVLRRAAAAGAGRRMRPGRPGTGSRASSRSAAWSAWSRRRAKIPRATGDRVKTDRRDAEHARAAAAGRQAARGPRPGR